MKTLRRIGLDLSTVLALAFAFLCLYSVVAALYVADAPITSLVCGVNLSLCGALPITVRPALDSLYALAASVLALAVTLVQSYLAYKIEIRPTPKEASHE